MKKIFGNNNAYVGGLFLSFILSCIVSGVVAFLFLPKAIVAWDEAANMVWGYKIYDALRHYEWGTTVRLSGAQVYYPPLQSWFIGITSLITGFSIPTVRLTNLLWVLAIGPLMFHIGYSIGEKRRGFGIGLGACVLFLISPMTMVFSGIALKEIMGTALTLMSYIAYRNLEEKNRLRDALIAGCFVLVLFYFKYNYALLLCAGYAVLYGIHIATKRYADYRPMIMFWLVTSLGIVFWVLLQNTRLVSGYVRAQIPQTVDIGSLIEKIFFYPHSIIFVYAPHVVIGLGMVIAFFASIVWFGNTRIRTMWWIAFVYIVLLGLYSENLHERYMFSVMPFVYILTAHAVARLYDYLAQFHWASRIAFLSAGAFIVVLSSLRFPGLVYSVGAHALRSPIYNQPDYRDTVFDFNPSHWAHVMPESGAERPSDVISYVFSRIGQTETFAVVGNANELSPKYWELSSLLADKKYLRSSAEARYIVGMTILPGSRFYTRDYVLFNAQGQKDLDAVRAQNRYVLMGEKVFPDVGIRVFLYIHADAVVHGE